MAKPANLQASKYSRVTAFAASTACRQCHWRCVAAHSRNSGADAGKLSRLMHLQNVGSRETCANGTKVGRSHRQIGNLLRVLPQQSGRQK